MIIIAANMDPDVPSSQIRKGANGLPSFFAKFALPGETASVVTIRGLGSDSRLYSRVWHTLHGIAIDGRVVAEDVATAFEFSPCSRLEIAAFVPVGRLFTRTCSLDPLEPPRFEWCSFFGSLSCSPLLLFKAQLLSIGLQSDSMSERDC